MDAGVGLAAALFAFIGLPAVACLATFAMKGGR